MKSSKKISVVIPVYNESAVLKAFYDRLLKAVLSITDNYEFLFINDGSVDDSLSQIIQLSEVDTNIFYINFSRNFGHQIAVSAGLKYVTGDCTVIIDSDLQDPPELIGELFNEYKKGLDVVYAKRNIREGETWFKKVSAKWFYRLLNKMTAIDIPLDAGDFRLIDKRVVAELNNMKEQNKFLRGQVAWIGFKQGYVSYNRESRHNGTSGYSLSKMFKLAFDAITSFSDKPLLYVTRFGFLISFFSFCVIIFAIFSHFFLKQTITGWTSLIISSTFIGGIQLLSVGVIGEYISRINANVKQRPLFVIEATNLNLNEDTVGN